jgi:thiol-disulfide isomerase/thioredoxin
MKPNPSHAAGAAAARIPEALRLWTLVLLLSLSLAQANPGQQTSPPERRELQAALKIGDLNARLKELERIKAAYPRSGMMAAIDRNILAAKVDLAETLDKVEEIQKPSLSEGEGTDRFLNYYLACERVFEHPKLDGFDKARVTALVESYFEGYLKATEDSAVLKAIPEDERKYTSYWTADMCLFLAQAYLREARADKLREALEKYKKAGGSGDAAFSFFQAEALSLEGKPAAAYEYYFTAAVDNYRDSESKARSLHQKLRGTTDGFDAALDAKRRELPFPVRAFSPPSGWSGKAVLVELFTGSECPPCVGADLGFDGLLEAFDRKYLVILEYHLPIPGPDPLMTPASKARQEYYASRGTPTPFFDGEQKFGGGGPRAHAAAKYSEYRGEVEKRVMERPQAALEVTAERRGGIVAVSCSFEKVLPGSDYNVALVEKEVRYKGGNGIVFHKMVVRDFMRLDPSKEPARLMIDLAQTEAASAKHLADYEKEMSFVFKEKKSSLDPANLAVVFFVQDRTTKKVANAAFAEVR